MNKDTDYNAKVIEAVERASKRSAKNAHVEMKRGLSSLASIASIAPLLGFLATMFGIVGSFRGIDGDKTQVMAMMAGWISDAILPTAQSLLVAIPALWGYKYYTTKLEAFDMEMENAAAALANYLSIRFRFPN